jgi:hypothetical protein
MKNIIKILLLLLVSISFSSCDEAEELLDIKFNSELSADLNVVVPAEGLRKSAEMMATGFSAQATINPRADANIEKYIDKIKSLNVEGVTARVLSISAPVEIITGNIIVTDGSRVASWEINDFDVIVGASHTLDNSSGQWDRVNQILDGKKSFTARIEGTVDRSDVSFVIRITIKARGVANPF